MTAIKLPVRKLSPINKGDITWLIVSDDNQTLCWTNSSIYADAIVQAFDDRERMREALLSLSDDLLEELGVTRQDLCPESKP